MGLDWRAEAGRGFSYFSLKAQNCWLMICQTISSDAIVAEEQRGGSRF